MSALRIDLRYRAGARTHHAVLETDAVRVALVGPSGIGKTSLLRAMLGLDAEATGIVEVAGVRLDALAVEARDIGWVPQDAALFPHLTVRANLAFGAREQVSRIAEKVGVSALLDRDVGALSGGERQRVAIGRALARGPRVLLLDEPLSALDRDARREMAILIATERVARSAILILASHDEVDVAALADEVYVMSDEGTLTRRPSTR